MLDALNLHFKNLIGSMRSSTIVVLLLASCQPRERVEAVPEERIPLREGDPSVLYWHEARKDPRPLQIHGIQVDLLSGDKEVAAAVTEDPDGPGPAQAALEEPLRFAARKGFAAAVNANPFDGIPDDRGSRDRSWTAGKPVEVSGYAVEGGVERSPPRPANGSLWIDPGRIGHAGILSKSAGAKEAVAGFGMVLEGGAVVGGDDALHPRTAAGLDREGRRLWLVVVDGRRKGTSEGMTTRELGELMRSLGCWSAVNLDGGGSSVLLFSPRGKGLKVMNRPSGGAMRPVPVILGVKPIPAGSDGGDQEGGG